MVQANKISELVVNNLSMTYRTENGTQVHALEDVTFTLRTGGLLVVVGPSGCGKTTLLNIIAGFLAPTRGKVLLDGRQISGPGANRGWFSNKALFLSS